MEGGSSDPCTVLRNMHDSLPGTDIVGLKRGFCLLSALLSGVWAEQTGTAMEKEAVGRGAKSEAGE